MDGLLDVYFMPACAVAMYMHAMKVTVREVAYILNSLRPICYRSHLAYKHCGESAWADCRYGMKVSVRESSAE